MAYRPKFVKPFYGSVGEPIRKAFGRDGMSDEDALTQVWMVIPSLTSSAAQRLIALCEGRQDGVRRVAMALVGRLVWAVAADMWATRAASRDWSGFAILSSASSMAFGHPYVDDVAGSGDVCLRVALRNDDVECCGQEKSVVINAYLILRLESLLAFRDPKEAFSAEIEINAVPY